ncbi:ATP-binding cassette domain-containing protein [Novosphingobium resinovorum]|nr:ATP-binding cassette domain-containing protein [Novosphingobium resinovorum]
MKGHSMTSLALKTSGIFGLLRPDRALERLVAGTSKRLRLMARTNATVANGYVLASLGNRHWTLATVLRVIGTAARQQTLLDWYLLDASEAASLVTLHGYDAEGAARAVIAQTLRMRDLLLRAGIARDRIHLVSHLDNHPRFAESLERVRSAYAANRRFAGAVRNQVFSNLQPKLRRVGICNNRDPRLESLVEYLLRELALKTALARSGAESEFALKPEMPVWAELAQGAFAGLETFADIALHHETVVPADNAAPLTVENISYVRSGSAKTGDPSGPNGIHDVSFEAHGVVAIVGPSGAGKTTLLRALAGHLTAKGAIRLAGKDVSILPTERRGIVTVFQDFGLFPHLSGLENIVEGAHRLNRTVEECRWLAARYLRDLDIEHCAARLPRAMSGGEQQRTAIARALMAEPDLLLLDEPTAALDQLQRDGLKLVVQRLRIDRPELPIVLVSHDLDFALSVADHVGVMDAGRLLAFDRAEALLARPGSSRVAQILGGHNVLRGELGADGSFAVASLPVLKPGAADAGGPVGLIPYDAVMLHPAVGEPGARAVLTALTAVGAVARFSLRLDDQTELVGVAPKRSLPTGLAVGSEIPFWIAQDSASVVRE